MTQNKSENSQQNPIKYSHEEEKCDADDIKENIELALFNIVANMPGHVYWKDRNGVYLGCNDRQARSLGVMPQFI